MGKRGYIGARFMFVSDGEKSGVLVVSSDGSFNIPYKEFVEKHSVDIVRMTVDHSLEYEEPEEMLEGYGKSGKIN